MIYHNVLIIFIIISVDNVKCTRKNMILRDGQKTNLREFAELNRVERAERALGAPSCFHSFLLYPLRIIIYDGKMGDC